MTTLVIVESPNKVEHLREIITGDYEFIASYGHIRDLPQKALGLSTTSFKLDYEMTARGKTTVAKIREAVKRADRVFLATDPDREGEAISWHLAEVLGLKSHERVTFGSITTEKVEAGFAAPRQIDMQLVAVQEARRALDRIIGFRVSPALSSRTGHQLGAGRVQSPAIRLVVDRERAITAFKVTTHFGVELTFTSPDGSHWTAQWDTAPHRSDGSAYMVDAALAAKVASVASVTVMTFEDTEKEVPPPAPFTSTSLIDVAGARLKMSPKKIMDVAQILFEKGLITYHRTDSPNIDDEGFADISAYAAKHALPMAAQKRTWKAKSDAQEGHEAIRPSSVLASPEQKTAGGTDEQSLYDLIWHRAVASQLADARYAVRSVTLSGEIEATTASFIATGRSRLSPGWEAILDADSEDSDESAGTPGNAIPGLSLAQTIEVDKAQVQDKKTKPPKRFTQNTLVKEMARLGIGRPSTYGSIMENLTRREYVVEDKKLCLSPSPIGEKVRDGLVDLFAFVDLDYTRGLEDELDLVAEGKKDYFSVVSAAWAALDIELCNLQASDLPIEHPCAECGKAMMRRQGQHGFFWSCTGYPDCKQTVPDAKGKPGERKAPPPPSGFCCTACGGNLVRRKGISKAKKAYDFFSCSGNQKCEATYKVGTDDKPVFEVSKPTA